MPPEPRQASAGVTVVRAFHPKSDVAKVWKFVFRSEERGPRRVAERRQGLVRVEEVIRPTSSFRVGRPRQGLGQDARLRRAHG